MEIPSFEIATLRLQPGDILVVRAPQLTQKMREVIQAAMDRAMKDLPFKVPLIITDSKVELTTLKAQ